MEIAGLKKLEDSIVLLSNLKEEEDFQIDELLKLQDNLNDLYKNDAEQHEIEKMEKLVKKKEKKKKML